MADRIEWRVCWLQLTPVSEDEAEGFRWLPVHDRYPDEDSARAAGLTMRRLEADSPGVFRATRLECRRVTDWEEISP